MKHPPAAIAPIIGLLLATGCTGSDPAPPDVTPPGAEESTRTDVLEAGAKALQDNGPLAGFDVYLVGFHPMKDDPAHQMEAHHYCRQVNEDFAQCSLFDGNTEAANLTGVEYIISGRMFERLAADEQQYWHPHNGEILSGQLVAPSLPVTAEKALMKSKMNSYGKTWHTWQSRHGVDDGDALPVGPALLAWSFNRDGEARQGLIAARDGRMGISTAERREHRRDLQSLARPQAGVDVFRGFFPDSTPIPGVKDTEALNTPAAAEAAETPPQR